MLRNFTAFALALVALGGCGDGPICPSEIVMVIASPADGSELTSAQDAVADEPGVQTDVRVRSNLKEGDSFTLTVTDAGTAVATFDGVSDANGDVVFEGLTLPAGKVLLSVAADSECGTATETAEVTVIGDAGCALTIEEGPIVNEYFAPIPVLNSTNDSDPALPNFQANVRVTTVADFDVELFILDVAAGEEMSAGMVAADGDGIANFSLTLGQGRQALRATCVSTAGALSGASGTHTVEVDTEVPDCSLVAPADGLTIIPSLDEDDATPGTQVTLRGDTDGAPDVQGEVGTFRFDGADLVGSPIDSTGQSTVVASFGSPKSYEVSFSTQDHAGNVCSSATRATAYQTEGCAISLTSPSGVVTVDENPGEEGLQAELVAEVDLACVGQVVTATGCGLGEPVTAVVPGDGRTAIEVDLCAAASCEATFSTCTVEVTNPAGIVTFDEGSVQADTLGPVVFLTGVNPNPLPCGMTVTEDVDVDGNVNNGVQIVVELAAASAASSWIQVTTNDGTTEIPTTSGADTTITLADGNNALRGFALDQFGNQGQSSQVCNVSLAELFIQISPPADDGLVGRNDGTVSGSDLTFDFCGTVSTTGAAVTATIAGTDFSATVNGTAWCVEDLTLSEGSHQVTINASTGVQTGILPNFELEVDLTAPAAPSIVDATAPTRQSGVVQWTATGAASYGVKYATVPLTDGNFDIAGTAMVAPDPTGGTESSLVENLRAGTEYYFGVVSYDAAGNRSTAATIGPVIPDFTGTGAIVPPNDGDGDSKRLGFTMATGYFNTDGYADVAVSAPYKNFDGNSSIGVVYIYLGGPSGISTTPAFEIRGTLVNGRFGFGMTALKWNTDAYDDLAIGSPNEDGFNGRVYIFHGGAAFDAGADTIKAPTDANVVIGVNPTANWFTSSFLGWSLTKLRFDADNRDDLAIGAVYGGGGQGGAMVLFGGTTATTIMVSDTDAAMMGGASAYLFKNPQAATGTILGHKVFNLGKTEGPTDTTDDLGVVYQSEVVTANDRSYVFRGRSTKPASSGVTTLAFSATKDLTITTPLLNTHFGDSMASVPDLNGDGARDIVIASFTEGTNRAGRVRIVDGNAVGTHGIGDAGFLITTFQPVGVNEFGSSVLNNSEGTLPDVDNDGIEDLVITGGSGQAVRMYIWFGGGIPTGTAYEVNADHIITAPASFDAVIKQYEPSPIVGRWANDLDGDGLGDICWADFTSASLNGRIECLFN